MTATRRPTSGLPASPAPDTAAAPELAGRRSEAQPLRTLQMVLFTVGAALMPLAVVVVYLGWYGASHAKYDYDQWPYIISGGCLGIVLSIIGGFLCFGSWLARVDRDQRETTHQLSETMMVMADVLARLSRAVQHDDVTGVDHVLVGSDGRTVHRRDCGLIAQAEDLRLVTGAEGSLTECRVCQPQQAG